MYDDDDFSPEEARNWADHGQMLVEIFDRCKAGKGTEDDWSFIASRLGVPEFGFAPTHQQLSMFPASAEAGPF